MEKSKKEEKENQETENQNQENQDSNKNLENTDSVLDSVVGNMSQVNPDVKKQGSSPSETPENSPIKNEGRARRRVPKKGVTDKHGNPFDDNLHEVDLLTGKPKVNKKDGYLKMKAGRPKSSKKHVKATIEAPKVEGDPAAFAGSPSQEFNDHAMECAATAELAVDTFINGGRYFFGDEWAPVQKEGYDERGQLVKNLDRYFRVKGIKDVPPGVAVLGGFVSYAFLRIHKPKTKTAFEKLLDKAKFGIFKLFEFLKGKRKNASQPDLRTDGKREDDSSTKASA